ncbi:hypothetical protein [Pseudonocardia charpentierae]|uniref:Uncharacterized protein n=1 Tax=Pseudonocardia charpentierae TaxID=3075545 RepID=A0ABU2NC82_9PSEU|nr:hypothetical protein [Pseudonocardia sp. DSM 45834]MDT0351088.1 hypothetical protein [Pseudonocardia sp. DSM 45834]
MTTPNKPTRRQDDSALAIEKLARRQGVMSIKPVNELARSRLWESDEEYKAFAFVTVGELPQ